MLTRLNILVCGNTRLVLILIILNTFYFQDNHSIFDSDGSRGGSKGSIESAIWEVNRVKDLSSERAHSVSRLPDIWSSRSITEVFLQARLER